MEDTRLIGFNLTKIEAEKKEKPEGKLEINSNIDIKNIGKHKIGLGKQEALKVDFSFLIEYTGLGKIELHGTLYLLVDPKLMKQSLSDWKNKKVSTEFQLTVLNIIVQKSSLRAFQLEEELGLPIHIQLPRIQAKKESE